MKTTVAGFVMFAAIAAVTALQAYADSYAFRIAPQRHTVEASHTVLATSSVRCHHVSGFGAVCAF